MNVRADHYRILDLAARLLPLRKLSCALITMLPKVDAFSQPIVRVTALSKMLSAEQYALYGSTIAAAIAYDKPVAEVSGMIAIQFRSEPL